MPRKMRSRARLLNAIPVSVVMLILLSIAPPHSPSVPDTAAGAGFGGSSLERPTPSYHTPTLPATPGVTPLLSHEGVTGAHQSDSLHQEGAVAAPANEVGTLPHPSAIPLGAASSYSGHYYAGAQYTGSSTTATSLQVTLGVPDDFPESGVYFVVLSVWDNAGSYDQLGLVNWYGSWGIVYSTSTYCAATYYVNDFAQSLTRGTDYLFDMSISTGTVHFSAFYASNATSVWSYSTYTGGTNFQIAGSYSCNGGSSYGYTDYEEVYSTAGPVVPYDLFFTYNWASFGYVGTWGIFSSSAPSGVSVYINGGSSSNGCGNSVVGYCPVTIANEPYHLSFTNGQDTTTVEPTASPRTYYWDVTVSDLSPDSPISLVGYSQPGSWTLNIPTSEGSPTFVSEFSFSFPSTTPPGLYYIGIVAFDGSGSYDRVSLGVNVLPMLSSSPSGSPGSEKVDVGQAATFSANPEGGSGGYSYEWISLPPGCSTSLASSIHCVPVSAGTFSIDVSITDSLGYSAVGSSFYVVDSDPTITTPTASRASADVGQSITFTTDGSGGSGGLTYEWSGLPSGCAAATSATATCSALTTAYTFEVTAAVTDSNSFRVVSAVLTYTVDPAVSVVLAVSTASLLQGGSVTITATATGGSGDFEYTWGGLPAGCSAATGAVLTCAPSASGTFHVNVTVTDSNGESGLASTTLTVNPSLAGLPAGEAYALIGGSVATAVIIAAAATILLLRRRKTHRPPVQPISQDPPTGQPPSPPAQ